MSKDDKLVPDLVRQTIQSLTSELDEKRTYISQLEEKLKELETENYFLRRNKQIEIIVEEEEEPNHNVEEGLKKMGIEAEDLEELSDLLDEALGKEDTDKNE
tara:strand:+ start:171 stop:476 length:306 start_codon:yes stop_codon:yes gene_type:complete